MALFSHPTLDPHTRLSVGAGRDGGGYRLLVQFPDGRQLEHRFASEPDLHQASTRLRADLLGEGWRIVSTGGGPRRARTCAPGRRRGCYAPLG